MGSALAAAPQQAAQAPAAAGPQAEAQAPAAAAPAGGETSGGTGTGATQYNPYVDLTLDAGSGTPYSTGGSGYDFASAGQAGVTNATLAFITADPNGQPAWGGYS